VSDSLAQFFSVIDAKERFVVACHIHPDGDAIGSLLAIGLTLKKLGKQVQMICSEGVPSVYHFLPCNEEIRQTITLDFNPQVLICVDCAEKDRVAIDGAIWNLPGLITVNLDHHITNTMFATLDIVYPKAAATGEVVYSLLVKGNYQIDDEIALAIYTAIATDTGFFRYDSTSAFTLEIASRLVQEYDVKPSKVAEQVHEQKSFNSIKLLGEILSKIQLTNEGKVAWVVLDQSMLSKYPVENEETESYVNYARSIDGVEIGLLFKELKPNEVKLSWRSTAAVDVSKLAAYFGGGGHARAAGCNLSGPIDQIVTKVLNFINEYYEAQK
jgi:phosphoesterase RecJ-like protein